MKQVLLLVSHYEIHFPGGAGRESIGKAGRYNRPAQSVEKVCQEGEVT